jgi:hypothetical protein
LHEAGLVRPCSGVAELRRIGFGGRDGVAHLDALPSGLGGEERRPGGIGPSAEAKTRLQGRLVVLTVRLIHVVGLEGSRPRFAARLHQLRALDSVRRRWNSAPSTEAAVHFPEKSHTSREDVSDVAALTS